MAWRTMRAAGMTGIGLLALSMSFAGIIPGTAQSATPHPTAHVYVLTGFLGFQTRLHGAVEKVERRHVPVTVGHALEWSSMAASAIDAYKSGQIRSVIIVGYSLGGGSALKMATRLDAAHVPVALIVTVEPVEVSDVPANVRRAVNYYLPNGWGSALHAGGHFHGSLRNVAEGNPRLDHFSLAIARENDVVNQVLSAAAPPAPAPSAPPRS